MPTLTYANATATIALVVALSGTSYAALVVTGKDVKNSSLTGIDIKNSSLKGKDVKNGSLRKKDLAPGTVPVFPAGTLPSGKTITGVYRAASGGDSGSIATSAQSFALPLAANPIPHFIADGALQPIQCRGSIEAPAADPGHLCVYEAFSSANGDGSQMVVNPVTVAAPGASRFGFAISIQASANGNYSTVGTWAVTAP